MKISKLKQIIREEYKNHQGEMLLREVIRHTLLNEVKVGDIKAAMEIIKTNRKKDAAVAATKQTGKVVVKAGVKALISLIPGGGAIWQAIEDGKDIASIISAASKDLSPEEKRKIQFGIN
jgi:hypothetical protein